MRTDTDLSMSAFPHTFDAVPQSGDYVSPLEVDCNFNILLKHVTTGQAAIIADTNGCPAVSGTTSTRLYVFDLYTFRHGLSSGSLATPNTAIVTEEEHPPSG